MDAQQRVALKSRLADVHASFEQAEQSIVLRHTCPSCDTLAGWNSQVVAAMTAAHDLAARRRQH